MRELSCPSLQAFAGTIREAFREEGRFEEEMNRLGVIGTSYKLLDIDAIAKYHLGEDPLPSLKEFKEFGRLEDILYLSTCNRIEYYYRGDPSITAREHRSRLTAWYRKRGVAGAGGHHFYALQGSAAARHLFTVACSLDSMVVGETQILDQLKQAHEFALSHGLAGKGMTRLLEIAYSTAHRVRRETRLCERPVSVASLAAQEVLSLELGSGPLKVLLIGAGATISKAGSRLGSNPAGKHVELMVANRSLEKGRELAKVLGAGVLPLEQALNDPPEVDAVISAVSTEEPLLTETVVRAMLQVRAHRGGNLLVVDLGLPPNTETNARSLEGLRVVLMDDIKDRARKNMEAREGEVEKAERIVDAQMQVLNRRMAEIAIGPSVAGIKARFDETMSAELDRLFSDVLPGLDQAAREKVRTWARTAAKRMAAQELLDVKSLLVGCERCPTNAPCLHALKERDRKDPQKNRSDSVARR